MTVSTLTCETCPNPIERTGKRGPAPRFCDSCKLNRHNARQRARYTKKGRNTPRPGAQKYRPGWTSSNGQLTLVRRIAGDAERAWFECACGAVAKLLHIRNVASGRTKNCAERDWHADPRMKTGAVSYKLAHTHAARALGKARDLVCVDTGKPAAELSYRGWCDQEQTEPMHSDYAPGAVYCEHPEHYHPRTIAAHRQYDRVIRQFSGAKATGNTLFLVGIAHLITDADTLTVEEVEA
ncbi:hypothetical protein [Streptomyces pseudogriseolus]|uniref:hypothetical protein n=1 Tax=Streptomyces pseudogriseolus TaxID=36817 RepID=UPI0034957A69